MAGSNVGRLVVDVMTNKSGGAVAYGDPVINDGSNDHSFTTTTTGGFTAGIVGVCIEPNGIANNGSGRIQTQGYCPQVNCNASVTRGYFLKTHTVAKQATGSATRVVGSFGVALKTSATPDAMLWGLPDASSATGNVATDAIWDAAGDLAVGTGADTAAKLTLGTAYKTLRSNGTTAIWDGFHGARCHHSTTQTVSAGAGTSMLLDTEDFDTDAFHFTSAAALTGTVTKAASSAAIVGSSTLFTSELAVGQVISIPGTAVEIGVVQTITDNTHLTLYQTMANNASGQTATRRNEFISIPAGMGGYYRISGGARWGTITTAKVSWGSVRVSGVAIAFNSVQSVTSSVNIISVATEYACVAGDYIDLTFTNNESGTVTISGGVAYSPFLAVSLIGV